MTNINLKTLLFIVTFLFSFNAFAEIWHTTYIKIIYPVSNGNFIIVPESTSLCLASVTPYYRVIVGSNGMTEKGVDKIYAAALAAHIAHKKVNINFDETDANCPINRIQVLY